MKIATSVTAVSEPINEVPPFWPWEKADLDEDTKSEVPAPDPDNDGAALSDDGFVEFSDPPAQGHWDWLGGGKSVLTDDKSSADSKFDLVLLQSDQSEGDDVRGVKEVAIPAEYRAASEDTDSAAAPDAGAEDARAFDIIIVWEDVKDGEGDADAKLTNEDVYSLMTMDVRDVPEDEESKVLDWVFVEL